jgi:lipase ATG15
MHHLIALFLVLYANLTLCAQHVQTTLNLHHDYYPDELGRTVLSSVVQPGSPSVTLSAVTTTVYRPRSSLESLKKARLRSLRDAQSERIDWDPVEVLGPDVEDQHTLAELARMAGNAYAGSPGNRWYDIDPEWNAVRIFYLRLSHIDLSQYLYLAELSVRLGGCSRRLSRPCLPFAQ